MSQYSGITAEQARTFSSAEAASPPETLAIVESIVGQAAENQQVSTARAVLSRAAHTKQGIEYAALHLTSRGFNVDLGENGPYYTIDISW